MAPQTTTAPGPHPRREPYRTERRGNHVPHAPTAVLHPAARREPEHPPRLRLDRAHEQHALVLVEEQHPDGAARDRHGR